MQEIIRFGLVGTIGFVVDAGMLLLFVRMGASPLLARLGSFAVAASVTFLLNHRFTFRVTRRPTLGTWSFYVAVTAVGAFVNISVYHAWILQAGNAPLQLLAGTAVGSLTAMCLNYTLSRMIVFDQGSARKTYR